MRVFGKLEGDSDVDDNMLQKATQEKTSVDSVLLTDLQAKLQVLEAEKRSLIQRLEDKEKNLEDMRQALRLLEDMRSKETSQ